MAVNASPSRRRVSRVMSKISSSSLVFNAAIRNYSRQSLAREDRKNTRIGDGRVPGTQLIYTQDTHERGSIHRWSSTVSETCHLKESRCCKVTDLINRFTVGGYNQKRARTVRYLVMASADLSRCPTSSLYAALRPYRSNSQLNAAYGLTPPKYFRYILHNLFLERL